ncbi:MAG: ABC transporter ATP-binding protein [Bacilli bacterium]|nr:ABC transporter ATP-binding protein [Mycoplasmatota bacterium]MDD6264545.1 ABC transporter ATP-binding protein [bacterium]MDD6942008.1 ABC transporter ATP-binding protein [bacterium]MDY2697652.1 ABC transporter ATP-binding protein [Bacilli bacterium]MEE0015428.1 ABC transporter ATP-binding protein [Bacilli bacterium]
MIEIKNVSKTYNDNIKAIDNLNLKINDGEIVGFIGLNGAGKTTAIKMMTGILVPDTGTITINGYDIVKDSLKAKQIIGYIADNPDMFLKLTGIEFINFIADIYKVPVTIRKKRIKLFGERFGLSDVLDKPMQGYSHGTRQKMMVVAALVHDPAVWILDEPLIGLDPTSAFELKKMMREHADKGNAVFFSTHVLEVAEKLCDRIAIIDKGKIVFVGTLKELKDKYDKKDLEKLFMEVIKND